MRFPSLALACSFALLLASADTRADAGEEPPGYRLAVDDGLREFEAQNFQEARSLFRRAHAIYPNARTYRALGLAEYELRNYVDSIEYLRAALGSTLKPLTEAQRTETQQVLSRAEAFVDRITFALKPAGVRVAIDQTAFDLSRSNSVLLAIGEHSVEFSGDGLTTERRTVKVKGGDAQTISLVLAPVAAEDTAKASEDSSAKPWYKRPWLWAGVGVLVLGAAAGTGYGIWRSDHEAPMASGGTSRVRLDGP